MARMNFGRGALPGDGDAWSMRQTVPLGSCLVVVLHAFGDGFSEGELGFGDAAVGVEEAPGIFDELVQRHVAHHAHRAEAFRAILGDAIHRFGGVDAGDGGEREVRPLEKGRA